jgi:hypothetical protein
MSASRGYTIGLISVVAAACGIALAVNTTVNPWRVTPMPWSSQKLDPYRDISSQIRTGKAGIVRANKTIDAALVGSSRVANGLDPEYSGWQGKTVVNLGCSGGFIYESSALARYLLAERKVDTILFGVDPGDLSSLTDTRPLGDFASSPLAGKQDRFNRELRYLIGVSTYTPKGLRARPKKKGQRSQLDFIQARIQGEAEFDVPDTSRPAITPAKAKLLEDLMREARAKNTRFIAFIHPTHAMMNARAADAADPPVVFEAERRAVLETATRVNAETHPGPPIEVWDFCDYHPLNCDPLPQDRESSMLHWGDLGHYSIEVGNLIQSRIMGWPLPIEGGENYGTRLSPETLEPWLEHVRQGYRAYLSGPGATDVARKEAWITEAEAKK